MRFNPLIKSYQNSIWFLLQVSPEANEDGHEHVDTDNDSTDGINDQQEEISPPKPKLQPIIAPDMFPPLVVLTFFLIKLFLY
jgi:hypothetical protein